ncbi:putative T7SS-secreted protein [Streptomyces erythrochromogenes]|uniref:putative T7SS-secreted protein n=1 Tax=Streptomyces erythrochromogenes TaxID=285574 RepID=UPI00380EE295
MTDLGGLLDKGTEKLGHAVDSAKSVIGQGVDTATDAIGAGLDYVGAHDWADEVEDFGDDVAHRLGARPEKELGQTRQAAELLHGKPDRIWESAAHLKDFQAAFNRVGQGMKALDSGHWKGAAADAFREKFAMHPTDWFHAADACEAAGNTLMGYAETVIWAQRQAQAAIELYQQGVAASKEAANAHKTRTEAYEAAVKAGLSPGPCPDPGADPGEAARKRAREILDEARRQRDDAARDAERAITAATDHAPAKPSTVRQIVAEFMDYEGSQALELTHVLGGALKGTAGILNFGRGLNPADPYNLTHPAEYQQHLNMTLAALVSTTAHPERIPAGLIESLQGDFSEGIGRLFPEFVGTKGSLSGARAGLRVGEEVAENAGRREASAAAKTEGEAPAAGESGMKGEGDPPHRDGESVRPDGDRPHLMRQDDDFSAEYNSRGQRKAHLNADGDLVPANPDGQASIVDHVVGRDPAKSDSPYTSLSSDGADAKAFGAGKIRIDLPRLEQDIASGRVQGVEVHSPAQVQQAIQSSADGIAGRPVDLTVPPGSSRPEIEAAAAELGLSKTKTKRIVQRMVDMMNTRRDEEWLIKGIVPRDYITGP